MNRTDIAKAIAEDLLNNDVLDENNFILEHLKDYSLLSGIVF